MFSKIADLLRGDGAVKADAPDANEDPAVAARFACACLLIEAAAMDGAFDADERTRIALILAQDFDLDGAQVQSLMDEAGSASDGDGGIYRFTRKLKDATTPEERPNYIEMMWEVVLADGELVPLEDQLIRRVAGLIGVTDQDRGAARKRAEARLGDSSASD